MLFLPAFPIPSRALSVMGPVTYAPRIAGITRLRMTPAHRWQIVMDDLRFGSGDGSGDGSTAKTAE
jgi:hypothetical protein